MQTYFSAKSEYSFVMNGQFFFNTSFSKLREFNLQTKTAVAFKKKKNPASPPLETLIKPTIQTW